MRHCTQPEEAERKGWIGLGTLSALLVLLQSLTFFSPKATTATLDAISYGLMAIGILWLLFRCLRAVQLHERAAFSLTFGSYGWG